MQSTPLFKGQLCKERLGKSSYFLYACGFHSPTTFLNLFMQSIFIFLWSFLTISSNHATFIQSQILLPCTVHRVTQSQTWLGTHTHTHTQTHIHSWFGANYYGKWILFSYKSLLLSYLNLVPFCYLEFLKSSFLEVNLDGFLLSFVFPPLSLQPRFSFPLNLKQIFTFVMNKMISRLGAYIKLDPVK